MDIFLAALKSTPFFYPDLVGISSVALLLPLRHMLRKSVDATRKCLVPLQQKTRMVYTGLSPHAAKCLSLRQGPLAAALADTFGSVDGFVNAFTQKAVTLFGSGWVWLYVDLTSGNARLSLTTTPNQDTPAMTVCCFCG